MFATGPNSSGRCPAPRATAVVRVPDRVGFGRGACQRLQDDRLGYDNTMWANGQ
jgi:hypothetical protein